MDFGRSASPPGGSTPAVGVPPSAGDPWSPRTAPPPGYAAVRSGTAVSTRALPSDPRPPSAAHDLETLINSRNAAVALETDEEDRALAILDEVGFSMRVPVYDWTLTRGLARRGTDQVIYETNKPVAALNGIATLNVEAIFVLRDIRSELSDSAVSRALRDVMDQFQAGTRRSTLIIVGTRPDLPAELADRVVPYPLGLPTDAEYHATVSAVASSLSFANTASVALAPPDYHQLAAACRGLTLNQTRQVVARVAIEDGVLDLADVPRIVDLKAKALGTSGLLEYFPPDDNVATLGGFKTLDAWLARARVGFSPQARAMNLPEPKGVLLTGVQGCGKSLAAKAIARAWGMPLVKLDAGRLYDKYIGESERNLRRTLEIAGSLAPVVLWIDEIEKAVATGGGDGSDGGLSQRLLGTLLTWMSEHNDGVFLVATANDVFKLPPELLRKGRFDELFFVDLPSLWERGEILTIHLQMRRQNPAVIDVAALAAATDGFSGAELEQVVVGALLGSLQAQVAADTAMFLREAGATVPLSTSRAEDITRLRALAQGRFVRVSGDPLPAAVPSA